MWDNKKFVDGSALSFQLFAADIHKNFELSEIRQFVQILSNMVLDPNVAGHHAQVGAGKGCGVYLAQREEVDRPFTYELGSPMRAKGCLPRTGGLMAQIYKNIQGALWLHQLVIVSVKSLLTFNVYQRWNRAKDWSAYACPLAACSCRGRNLSLRRAMLWTMTRLTSKRQKGFASRALWV